MVDLQAHILPGLDDGAADETTALQMGLMAAAAGTREIVAAPVCDPQFEHDLADVEAKIERLQQQLGDRIFIHRGAVLTLGHDTIETALKDLTRYSINGRKYLLVQPSSSAIARGAGALFSRIRRAGFVPVVAEPESLSSIRKDVRRVRFWIERGCAVSICGGSLLGLAGERTEAAVAAMLDADLVDFITSAGRSTGRRAPVLDDAYDYVSYRWGAARAQRLMVDNPWQALWGGEINRGDPQKPDRGLLTRIQSAFH